jgi:hypothetical protein
MKGPNYPFFFFLFSFLFSLYFFLFIHISFSLYLITNARDPHTDIIGLACLILSLLGMKTARIFSDRIRDRIRLEGF